MNIPFHLMSLETKVQVIIAYADMALVNVGRFIQASAPLTAVALVVAIAMLVLLFPFPKRRRRCQR